MKGCDNLSKDELLAKMKGARSWREFGMTVAEVYSTLANGEDVAPASNDVEIQKLKDKIERLTEANKQLRAENKELRGK